MIFDDLGGATPGTAKTIKGLAKNASRKPPATPQTTEKPSRNASTNTTPPPYHSHACKAQPCRSCQVSLENLERSTTYDRNKRANASVYHDFLSACGVATA